MPKSKTFEDLSLAPYKNDRELWRWLYQQLRLAIQDGRLRTGTRLPSTRDVARQYELSRGTVVAAFDQLQAEGYTRVEAGSGTYVETNLQNQSTSIISRKSVAARKSVTLSKIVADMVESVFVM